MLRATKVLGLAFALARLDQVGLAQQDPRALWAAYRLPTAEHDHVGALVHEAPHVGPRREIVRGVDYQWDAPGVCEVAVLVEGQRILGGVGGEQVGGRGRVVAEGSLQLFAAAAVFVARLDEYAAADTIALDVREALAPLNDDLVPHAGAVGQAPHLVLVGPRDAGCRLEDQSTRRSAGYEGRLDTHRLGYDLAGPSVQLMEVYGVLKALETVEITSGRAFPPPYTLMGPAALTMGRTPIDLYSSAASWFNECSWEE